MLAWKTLHAVKCFDTRFLKTTGFPELKYISLFAPILSTSKGTTFISDLITPKRVKGDNCSERFHSDSIELH